MRVPMVFGFWHTLACVRRACPTWVNRHVPRAASRNRKIVQAQEMPHQDGSAAMTLHQRWKGP